MSDRVSGQTVAMNVSATALIKSGAGRVVMASRLADGIGATFHDCATTGEAAIGNQIAFFSSLNGLATMLIDMPFYAGLVIVPTGAFSVTYL